MNRRTALTLLAVLGGLGVVASFAFTVTVPGRLLHLADLGIPTAAFWLTGVIAFWVKPDHLAAQRLLLVGGLLTVAFGLASGLDAAGAATTRSTSSAWVLNTLAAFGNDLGFAAWFALFASFPSGRYPNRGVHAAVLAAYALAALTAVANSLAPHPEIPMLGTEGRIASPAPAALAAAAGSFPLNESVLFLLVPVSVALLLGRTARSSGEERLQLAWPLLAMALLSAVVLLGSVLPPPAPPYATSIVFGLLVSAVPASLLLGMLRYRLLDMDLVLRRSLTYGALWLGIAVAYAGVAALAGLLAGQRLSVTTAVLVTIVAAMLFQPARERLERFADRVIFGDREGGYDLIRRLGAVLEGTLPPDEVAPRIAATVRDGMAAGWSRIWVCERAGPRRAGAAGVEIDAVAPAELVVPLVHGDELVGFLECGPRRAGAYTARDEEAIQALSRQAAVAIVNSRLAAELAASLTRLVKAEAEERRRIERDIHDGVQQQLVALMARLSLARTQLAGSPEMAVATLTDMQGDFRAVVTELRDLANGIHPAVLTDRGLVAALEARAARLPLALSIHCPPELASARFAPEVEAAAYFATVEAIGNALKHASASLITLTLTRAGGRLEVTVADDGRGFDPAGVPVRGLSGLRDRVEAVAGRLTVASQPGSGTTVELSLPLPEAAHA